MSKRAKPTSLKTIPKEGKVQGTTDGHFAVSDSSDVLDGKILDVLHAANEETQYTKERRWVVQTVFGFDREQEEKGTKVKKAVVFFFKPPSVEARQTSSILALPGDQRELGLREAREESHNLVARDGFVIEDDNTGISLPKISRDRLVDFIYEHWQAHPVYGVGDVRLSFQHVEVHIPREKMVQSSGREEIFKYIRDILDLMDKGFMYDPWAKGLRRIDEKGIGPWLKKR